MEPALDERGDAANSSAVMPSSRAAMEPALDERGDAFRRQPAPAAPRRRNGARSRRVGRPAWTSQRPGRTRPQWSPLSTSGATRWTFSTPSMTRGPQWSPLSTSGATTATYGDQPLTMTEPQWSPLSTSGATTIGGAYVVDRAPPQWSPLSTSGATQPARRRRLWRAVAAMEPALDERGDPAAARLPGAGRRSRRARVAAVLAAAMEPALDERGDPSAACASESISAPQWSPLSTSGATGPRRR